jgi:hypothetical protein
MCRIVLSLALAAAFAGCGPGAECVIDTDCPFERNAYCSEDGVCVPRGTSGRDAGSSDAGPSDGGPRDAPPTDARASDAALDAPAADAPAADAPSSSCPAVAGSYPLTRVGVECAGLTATNLVLSGPASPTNCSFEVRLDASTVGAVAQTTGNTFGGTLSVLGGTPACTFVFASDLRSVDVTCDRCLFSAARP